MSEDWLKLLYDSNYDMLFRLASNRLSVGIGHSSDVQDVLQEVFLLASKKKIFNHPNPEGWLIITTANVCKNYIQANARRIKKYNKNIQEQLGSNSNRKQQYMNQSSNEIQTVDLQIAIDQILSNDECELLRQYYSEGLSFDEISLFTNIPTSTLRVRMHRIREKLKKFLN